MEELTWLWPRVAGSPSLPGPVPVSCSCVVPGSSLVAFALCLVLGGSRFSGGRRPLVFYAHVVIATDALIMENTNEKSRHCTVFQLRRYTIIESYFLHDYVDYAARWLITRSWFCHCCFIVGPSGCFKKQEYWRGHFLRKLSGTSRVCGGDSLSQRGFMTSSIWST